MVGITSLRLKQAGYMTEPFEADVMVEHYVPMVKKIAAVLMSRLPASIEIDDLIQVGVLGLIEALRQFDSRQGVQFETFASQRIRGAMLDELRRLDWLPRHIRKNTRLIEQAITQLEQAHGHPPQESDIAKQLGLTLAEYQSMLGECKGLTLVHFEDFCYTQEAFLPDAVANIADPNTPDPLGVLSDNVFRLALIHAIEILPERDQLVMSMYYDQELNLKEIGAVLGVSESRVCQLHSQAITRLRVHLKDWLLC